MDVDTIISSDGQRLSENEISQLIRTKKCFYCKGEGHRAENCWKKHGKPPQKSAVRMGTTEIMNTDEMAKQIKDNMDSIPLNTRLELIEKLMPSDQDFAEA